MDTRELERWREIYNDLSQACDHVKFSRLCLLSATGYRSMASWADINPADAEPMIRTLHEQTWSLVASALPSPYIDAVELILLRTILSSLLREVRNRMGGMWYCYPCCAIIRSASTDTYPPWAQ